MTRIFIFRVETEGFYTTLVIIPGNITIEIATERYEGERRRFCQRQAFCVCVHLNIANDTRFPCPRFGLIRDDLLFSVKRRR